MSLKTISASSNGWFFVEKVSDQAKKPTIIRVAAWGLMESGSVVGLVDPQSYLSSGEKYIYNQSLLSQPPSHIQGMYKHVDDFTEKEYKVLNEIKRKS